MGVLYLDIAPNVFEWAIARAGYDKPAAIATFPPLEKWLSGEKQPTLAKLKDFSAKFFVPFGYLFLPSPPDEAPIIPFFRGAKISTLQALNVMDEVNIVYGRQNWLSEYLSDNDFDPLPFVGSYKGLDVNLLVKEMRKTVGLDEGWAKNCSNPTEAVSYLTETLEDIGIAVEFSGIVGNSTKRAIEVEDCRGFSLVDEYAPFIFVNSRDSKTAQLFTLAHEFAHIIIGEGAGYSYADPSAIKNGELEVLCNKAAALFLVPDSYFSAFWMAGGIDAVSRESKTSRQVVARRAMEKGLIDRNTLQGYYTAGIMDNNKKPSGRGDFYRTQDKRLGALFQTHVRNAVLSGRLLYRDAFTLTGIKGDTFKKVFRLETV